MLFAAPHRLFSAKAPTSADQLRQHWEPDCERHMLRGEEDSELPLLQTSFKMMLDSLKPDDTVSIVTYAGNAGTALTPTPVKDKQRILTALDNLSAGGSTAGAEGIRQAYQLAEQNLKVRLR